MNNVLVVVFALLASLTYKISENPASSFVVADSISTPLNVICDSSEVPALYQAKVMTPVCEVDKCYIIEIEIYWDLIGRFHHFDTIPGRELTKLDHKPFNDEDYTKLQEILSNSNSPLANYSKEELVKNTRSSEIDGFTGATIQEIKENVIGGAVYSCHTMWHIAYGTATDSIQHHTLSAISLELVRKLVSMKDQEINYFLIDNFSDADFDIYFHELISTLEDGKGYYSKNFIEKVPAELVNDSTAQEYFADIYQNLDYFAKVVFLKKLDPGMITEDLKVSITNDLEDRNSLKDDLIRELVN